MTEQKSNLTLAITADNALEIMLCIVYSLEQCFTNDINILSYEGDTFAECVRLVNLLAKLGRIYHIGMNAVWGCSAEMIAAILSSSTYEEAHAKYDVLLSLKN